MTRIGFRVSPTAVHYVVATGTQADYSIVTATSVPLPQGREEPDLLSWARQEFDAVFSRHQPKAIGIKENEANRFGRPDPFRLKLEGQLQATAWDHGIRRIEGMRKTTIRSALGLNEQAKYVVRAVPDMPHGDGLKTVEHQEAFLVAVCLLDGKHGV